MTSGRKGLFSLRFKLQSEVARRQKNGAEKEEGEKKEQNLTNKGNFLENISGVIPILLVNA